MDEYEREMEIIALMSNIEESYTYIDCDKDTIEHSCEKTNEQRQINLIEIEYFKDAKIKEDKANFCEHCMQVFIYKPT